MSLNLSIVTPEQTLLSEQTDSVVVTLSDGEAGILDGHARMVGRLGFGELRFGKSGSQQHFYVDGGFVQVANNEVNILTGRALPVSQIDRKEVEQQLREAQKIVTLDSAEMEVKQRRIAQAQAQLRLCP